MNPSRARRLNPLFANGSSQTNFILDLDLDYGEAAIKSRIMLIGEFISKKHMGHAFLAYILRSSWSMKRDWSLSEIHPGTFSSKFQLEQDCDQISPEVRGS